MFKINNELFIDLEPFLDLPKIYKYYEEIAYGIDKNCDRIYPTPTSQASFLNQELVAHPVVSAEIKNKYPELAYRQSEAMAKFLGSANLGSMLQLKKIMLHT